MPPADDRLFDDVHAAVDDAVNQRGTDPTSAATVLLIYADLLARTDA